MLYYSIRGLLVPSISYGFYGCDVQQKHRSSSLSHLVSNCVLLGW
jgi:hypothetical protein